MATYTPNIGLHQWVPEDNFLRSDFNTDFQKIDTAVQAAADAASSKARAAAGAYIGDGTTTRIVNLGFRPKAVLVENPMGSRYGSHSSEYISGGLAVDGSPLYYQDKGNSALGIVSNGFQVRQGWDYRSSLNYTGSTYHYLAIK